MQQVKNEIRAYLEALNETFVTSKWVTIDMMTPEHRSWWLRFLFWLLGMTGIGALLPISVGRVITATSAHQYEAAYIATGIVCVLSIVQELLRRNADQAREWVWGIGMRIMEDRISRLLFTKSVGQHIQEGSRFTVGNIERGQAAAFMLRDLWLMELVPETFTLLAYPVVLMFAFPLGGAIMCAAVAVHLVWTVILNRYLTENGSVVDEHARKTRRYQRDHWEKVERVKTSGATAREIAHLDQESNTWISMDRTLWVRAINWFCMRGFVMHGGASLVMLLAVIHVAEGKAGVGILYAAFALAYSTKSELDRLSHTSRMILHNVPSVKTLRETLLMEPDVKDPVSPNKICEHTPICLSFENISHGFKNGSLGKTAILSQISFSIDAKKKTALIGPSGAGKTTIMRLALRYMDPDQGRVLVNGIDLRTLRLDDWMRAVGYIPQQPQIFDGTIGDNLRYGLADPECATDEEVWETARRVQADFGERLTEGLETLVGKNGLKLSGGQAQRVMIGAAALKKPRFMIIDEATSSLDATTERLVHDGLREVLGENVGALIVTHRLSTVRDLCDSFVILKPAEEVGEGENQIEAIGHSFEELFHVSKTFRRLATDQGILL